MALVSEAAGSSAFAPRRRRRGLTATAACERRGFGAALDLVPSTSTTSRGGVAVANLALAADLLEPVAARDQVLQHGSRECGPRSAAGSRRVGRIAADEEARRLDGALGAMPPSMTLRMMS